MAGEVVVCSPYSVWYVKFTATSTTLLVILRLGGKRASFEPAATYAIEKKTYDETHMRDYMECCTLLRYFALLQYAYLYTPIVNSSTLCRFPMAENPSKAGKP